MSTLVPKRVTASGWLAGSGVSAPNVFLLLMLVALGLGLVMMTSASMEIAGGLTGDPLYFAKRQVFFALLGMAAAVIALHVSTQVWYRASTSLLCIAMVLLVLVLIPG